MKIDPVHLQVVYSRVVVRGLDQPVSPSRATELVSLLWRTMLLLLRRVDSA